MTEETDSSKEELFSYIERLRKSGKLECVALLDLSGKVLAFSRGMDIGADDGYTIVKVIASPYRDLTGIKVGHQNFICFKNNEGSLVGKSDKDFLCCCTCVDFVIVGLSDPDSQGSSIYEVTRFVASYRRRSTLKEAGQGVGNRRRTLETDTKPDPIVEQRTTSITESVELCNYEYMTIVV